MTILSLDGRTIQFVRWDIPYMPGESGHGYYTRLAQRQGDHSLARFNLVVGITETKIVPEEMVERVLRLPLDNEVKAELARLTPRLNGTRYTIDDEVFAYRDLTFAPRRWCPACIGETPYHRVWFDICAIRHCPYHCIEIVDRDAEGHEVQWWSTDFAETTYGAPLGIKGISRQLADHGFARYVLGRLKLEKPIHVPLLDDVPMTNVIDACETMGVMLSNPRTNYPSDIGPTDVDVGFEAIRHGPGHLANQCLRWLENNPVEETGMLGAYTWAYHRLTDMGETGEFIRQALSVAHVFWRRKGASITDDDVTRAGASLFDLADMTGIRPTGVSKIAVKLGILDPGAKRHRALLESDADTIRAFADSLLTPLEVGKLLGLPRDAVYVLQKSGYLTIYKRLNCYSQHNARYDRAEVKSILETMEALEKNGNYQHSRPFRLHARTTGTKPGALAVDVMKGKVKIAGKSEGKVGFSGLMLDVGLPRKRLYVDEAMELLSMAEVVIYLGVHKSTVNRLVDMGMLVPFQRQARHVVFARKDIERMRGEVEKSTAFAAGLGLSKYAFRDLMIAKGIVPVTLANRGEYVDTLYSRNDVKRALGGRDPSVVKDPGLIRLWKTFAETAKRTIPKLIVPPSLSARGQFLGMTTRLGVVQCTYDLIGRELKVAVCPVKEGISMSFAADDEDPVPRMEDLFARIIEVENAIVAKRAEYRMNVRLKRDLRSS